MTSMMEEIICESEDIYGTPIQRELLPLILYRDMIRERWVWRCTSSSFPIFDLPVASGVV